MIVLCSSCTSGDYSDRTRYIYIERDSSWYHTPYYGYYNHDHHRHHSKASKAPKSSGPSSRPSRPPTSSPTVSNPDRTPAGKSPHDP